MFYYIGNYIYFISKYQSLLPREIVISHSFQWLINKIFFTDENIFLSCSWPLLCSSSVLIYYLICTTHHAPKQGFLSVGECWWVVWQCYLSLCCDTSLSSAVNTHKTAADTSDNLDDTTCTLEQLVWESESERVLNVRWSSWTKQSLVALLLFLKCVGVRLLPSNKGYQWNLSWKVNII